MKKPLSQDRDKNSLDKLHLNNLSKLQLKLMIQTWHQPKESLLNVKQIRTRSNLLPLVCQVFQGLEDSNLSKTSKTMTLYLYWKSKDAVFSSQTPWRKHSIGTILLAIQMSKEILRILCCLLWPMEMYMIRSLRLQELRMKRIVPNVYYLKVPQDVERQPLPRLFHSR